MLVEEQILGEGVAVDPNGEVVPFVDGFGKGIDPRPHVLETPLGPTVSVGAQVRPDVVVAGNAHEGGNVGKEATDLVDVLVAQREYRMCA